ncbi:DUF342 domain-containing protein [Oscillospiraceae bacterium CM]|nr:DUF342 domain-containing protein [Oscillospiraceae bacterium CM]
MPMHGQPANANITGTEPADKTPPKDAAVSVIIKNSAMSAGFILTAPAGGGRLLTAETLKAALARQGVTTNIDWQAIDSLAENPRYDTEVVVATGTEPIDGVDGTVTFAVRTENRGKPKMLENGRVDYYDLGLIENVRAGQILGKVTPPIDGTPGLTVTGQVVRQKPGKPAPIVLGPNTEWSQDGSQILSKINGQFEFDGKKVSVGETYTLNQDVDTSTGNIKVAGNLVIRGMVTSGLTIEAGGFITVAGIVESATVKSGGDLNLQGGALGSSIECKGNMKCRFVENCSVYASGDIRAEYILNSTVRSKKSLKTEGVISKIIGGTCIVMQNIECRTLGSSSGIKTKLQIGNDPDLVERQRSLSDMIPDLEKQLQSLEPLLKLLRQLEEVGRLTEEKQQMLQKASYSHNTISATLQSAVAELNDLNAALYNRNYGKVICTGTAYPGTVVTIGSALYVVSSNLMNTSFYYSDGEVAIGSAR